MTVDVVKPRALPYANGIRILSSRARDGSRLVPDSFSIQQLSCNLIVGLNPCEREDKQLVYFDVDISHTTLRTPAPESGRFDFRLLARDIRQVRPPRRKGLYRGRLIIAYRISKSSLPSLYHSNHLRPWQRRSPFATLISRTRSSPFARRNPRP
jgi:hypothetical protein